MIEIEATDRVYPEFTVETPYGRVIACMTSDYESICRKHINEEEYVLGCEDCMDEEIMFTK